MKEINFNVVEYLRNLKHPIVIAEQAVNSVTGETFLFFLN